MLQNETDNQEIFCPNCGIKNYSYSNFCYKCGSEIYIPSPNNTINNESPKSKETNDTKSDNALIGFGDLFNGKKSINSIENNNTNDKSISTNDPIRTKRKVVYDNNLTNQNDEKLGGCLISFLVFGIIGTAFTTIVIFVSYSNLKTSSNLSTYDTSNMGIIISLSILIGMLSIVCFIFLLNKLKIGLYILIILDVISFLMMFSNIDFINLIPFAIISGFLRYLILGLLMMNDWKKFS